MNRKKPAAKKRSHKRNPKNRSKRLTATNVRAIRARLNRGDKPAEIARDYKVSHVTISHIEHRHTWAWL